MLLKVPIGEQKFEFLTNCADRQTLRWPQHGLRFILLEPTLVRVVLGGDN